MKGIHAFCPVTGSQLSSDTHYDEDGKKQRVPQNDNAYGGESWLLTSGSNYSSKHALMSRFRDCHERHHGQDDELYRFAALSIRRLKAEDARDEWIWLALSIRLEEAEWPHAWMHSHVDLICPDCEGMLRWEDRDLGPRPECVDCDSETVWTGILERVARLYNQAFDDEIQPNDLC